MHSKEGDREGKMMQRRRERRSVVGQRNQMKSAMRKLLGFMHVSFIYFYYLVFWRKKSPMPGYYIE